MESIKRLAMVEEQAISNLESTNIKAVTPYITNLIQSLCIENSDKKDWRIVKKKLEAFWRILLRVEPYVDLIGARHIAKRFIAICKEIYNLNIREEVRYLVIYYLALLIESPVDGGHVAQHPCPRHNFLTCHDLLMEVVTTILAGGVNARSIITANDGLGCDKLVRKLWLLLLGRIINNDYVAAGMHTLLIEKIKLFLSDQGQNLLSRLHYFRHILKKFQLEKAHWGVYRRAAPTIAGPLTEEVLISLRLGGDLSNAQLSPISQEDVVAVLRFNLIAEEKPLSEFFKLQNVLMDLHGTSKFLVWGAVLSAFLESHKAAPVEGEVKELLSHLMRPITELRFSSSPPCPSVLRKLQQLSHIALNVTGLVSGKSNLPAKIWDDEDCENCEFGSPLPPPEPPLRLDNLAEAEVVDLSSDEEEINPIQIPMPPLTPAPHMRYHNNHLVPERKSWDNGVRPERRLSTGSYCGSASSLEDRRGQATPLSHTSYPSPPQYWLPQDPYKSLQVLSEEVDALTSRISALPERPNTPPTPPAHSSGSPTLVPDVIETLPIASPLIVPISTGIDNLAIAIVPDALKAPKDTSSAMGPTSVHNSEAQAEVSLTSTMTGIPLVTEMAISTASGVASDVLGALTPPEPQLIVPVLAGSDNVANVRVPDILKAPKDASSSWGPTSVQDSKAQADVSLTSTMTGIPSVTEMAISTASEVASDVLGALTPPEPQLTVPVLAGSDNVAVATMSDVLKTPNDTGLSLRPTSVDDLEVQAEISLTSTMAGIPSVTEMAISTASEVASDVLGALTPPEPQLIVPVLTGSDNVAVATVPDVLTAPNDRGSSLGTTSVDDSEVQAEISLTSTMAGIPSVTGMAISTELEVMPKKSNVTDESLTPAVIESALVTLPVSNQSDFTLVPLSPSTCDRDDNLPPVLSPSPLVVDDGDGLDANDEMPHLVRAGEEDAAGIQDSEDTANPDDPEGEISQSDDLAQSEYYDAADEGDKAATLPCIFSDENLRTLEDPLEEGEVVIDEELDDSQPVGDESLTEADELRGSSKLGRVYARLVHSACASNCSSPSVSVGDVCIANGQELVFHHLVYQNPEGDPTQAPIETLLTMPSETEFPKVIAQVIGAAVDAQPLACPIDAASQTVEPFPLKRIRREREKLNIDMNWLAVDGKRRVRPVDKKTYMVKPTKTFRAVQKEWSEGRLPVMLCRDDNKIMIKATKRDIYNAKKSDSPASSSRVPPASVDTLVPSPTVVLSPGPSQADPDDDAAPPWSPLSCGDDVPDESNRRAEIEEKITHDHDYLKTEPDHPSVIRRAMTTSGSASVYADAVAELDKLSANVGKKATQSWSKEKIARTVAKNPGNGEHLVDQSDSEVAITIAISVRPEFQTAQTASVIVENTSSRIPPSSPEVQLPDMLAITHELASSDNNKPFKGKSHSYKHFSLDLDFDEEDNKPLSLLRKDAPSTSSNAMSRDDLRLRKYPSPLERKRNCLMSDETLEAVALLKKRKKLVEAETSSQGHRKRRRRSSEKRDASSKNRKNEKDRSSECRIGKCENHHNRKINLSHCSSSEASHVKPEKKRHGHRIAETPKSIEQPRRTERLQPPHVVRQLDTETEGRVERLRMPNGPIRLSLVKQVFMDKKLSFEEKLCEPDKKFLEKGYKRRSTTRLRVSEEEQPSSSKQHIEPVGDRLSEANHRISEKGFPERRDDRATSACSKAAPSLPAPSSPADPPPAKRKRGRPRVQPPLDLARVNQMRGRNQHLRRSILKTSCGIQRHKGRVLFASKIETINYFGEIEIQNAK